MKVKLLALICSLSVGGFNVSADQDGNGHHSWTDQNGGQIQGHEGLEASVVLAPTENAPSDAAGRAKIEAENENGNVSGKLEVSVQGLPDGDYSAVVTLSDGSEVPVGDFTLGGSQSSGNDQEGDNDNESETESHHDGGAGGSRFDAALPDNVNPTDITAVTINDANGTPMLSGSVASSSSAVQYQATVRLKAGRAAPRANGTASATTVIKNGKATGRFSLNASSVPANSTFYLSVNGKVVGQTKSGPRGKVILQNVRSSQAKVRSVELKDLRGKSVVAGQF